MPEEMAATWGHRMSTRGDGAVVDRVRMGAVAVWLGSSLGCLTSTDDVGHFFNPKLKMTVEDPFEGARVEGSVIPIKLKIKGAMNPVTVTLTAPGSDLPHTLLTWPDQDHAEIDLGLPPGPVGIVVTAMEEHGAGVDEVRFRADVVRNFEIVGVGWPAIDYPATPASFEGPSDEPGDTAR
jgi:hypothetical protein